MILRRTGLVLLWLSLVQAQVPLVSRISFKGIKVTKPYILQREIQHPLNVPLDSALALEDRNRLLNLGIFADVYWRAIPIASDSVILEYEVVESPRFIGGPMPVYDEDTGWSLAVGLIWKNFRGRDETLMGGATFGGRRNFGLNFIDPWITGDHLSLNIETGRNVENHPFLPYEIRTNSFESNVGLYFGYTRKASLGFELEEKDFVNDTVKLAYRYFAPQGSFQYDTRDVYIEPTHGIHIVQSFYSILDLDRNRPATLFWRQSYSYFRLIQGDLQKKHLIVGLNLASRITLGDKDPIWQESIGGSFSVRGWSFPNLSLFANGSQAYRFGHHTLTGSVELRETMIPRHVTRFKTEFGLTLAWFLDAGLATYEFNRLLRQSPILGTGISIQIPYPFFDLIRLDYGWGFRKGKQVDRSFHFAFQQKF